MNSLYTSLQPDICTGPDLEKYCAPHALADLIQTFGARLDSKERAQAIFYIRYWIERALDDSMPELKISHPLEPPFRQAVQSFGDGKDNETGLPDKKCQRLTTKLLRALPTPIPDQQWRLFAEAQREGYTEYFALEYLLTKFGLSQISRAHTALLSPLFYALLSNDLPRFLRHLQEFADAQDETGKVISVCKAGVERVLDCLHDPVNDAEWHMIYSTLTSAIDRPSMRNRHVDRGI